MNSSHIIARRITPDILLPGTKDMAEFGIATGIAGLLSLTIQTYTISAKYISSVRNASKLAKGLLKELNALTEVLVDLDDLPTKEDEDAVSHLCLYDPREDKVFGINPSDTFGALTLVPCIHSCLQAIDHPFSLSMIPLKNARKQLTT